MSRNWIDTDVSIEADAGRTIVDIFADEGEAGFRNLESAQILGLGSLKESAIISLGGGAVLRSENRKRIRELGKTVWLQASVETIHGRIANDLTTQARRPKLSKLGDLEEIRTILETRWAWYNEVADLAINTDDLSMQQVAATVADWFQLITGAQRKQYGSD